MTVTVINALLRPLLEAHLPDWIEPRWYATKEEVFALAPEAEIGWFDMYTKADVIEAVRLAERMRWLNTGYAGLDFFPLDLMAQRGVQLTNGAGINAITIAEYVVLGMLSFAKDYPAVLRAQGRGEWLKDAPGKRELFESKALILGYGAIGQEIDRRLAAFGVEVTKVRRNSGPGTLGPDEWRARLGEFDWVILAVPQTAETERMIGAAELAAMNSNAVLINIARGGVVDQDALVATLEQRRIGGAFLDVTTPEPLPAGHPLWRLDNAVVTMHLSGRAQTRMYERAAERFLRNLPAFRAGGVMESEVDLVRGY
ncbi:D-2-hydroxyacid dehydrogenase [Novosphingobium sp. B 225]|uniref:D-2-hydroxyacid dehydrogenase n=1 Tax=Novosphingobium sp. B 225 TaxID=1961849 RepID=UPI000B4BB0C5|nr:D-2-hydroxyacid dehydrogenase [Novosphingobium sp. B 225]